MPPYLLLSFLLGTVYGTIFHLWRGKSIRDLVIFLITGTVGFILGHLAGNMLNLNLFLIGPLHVAEATLVSWLSLFIIQWLKI